MIALFVALGGGATAGTVLLITGKQVKNSSLTGADIKNNTLTSKDVKNLASADVKDGSLQAKDFAAGQLPAGAAGPAGATGPAGPLLDTLPSGKTIQGAYIAAASAAAAGAIAWSGVTFHIPLATAPTVDFIPLGGTPPAACPGTSAAPAAAAGQLCIYESSGSNYATPPRFSDPRSNTSGAGTQGVIIATQSIAAGIFGSGGTWAVTAP